ncbi:Uncharacterized protein Adt_43656 [Abeliophyllum distichum]|uniref:Uncharacterized protein n=1 Tax=Abeliophyllum distichum TaxID=126358 RepID=A0ABD1P8N7_9LAMI
MNENYHAMQNAMQTGFREYEEKAYCIRKGIDFVQHVSSKKLRSHSTFSPALSNAINSDSIVDRAMQVCFEDFQDTAAPPSVNTYPLVDLESFISDIQFASQYPSNTAGHLI